MNQTLAGALGGLLLGFGIGVVAMLLVDDPGDAALDSEPGTTVRAAADRGTVRNRDRDEPAPPGGMRELPRRVSVPGLREIVDAVPYEAVPTGDESITGVVRRDDGLPLSGVELELRRRDEDRSSTRAEDDESVELLVAAYAARLKRSRASERRAVTDGQGAFWFDGLAPGMFQLVISAPGYRFSVVEPVGATLHRVPSGSDLAIAAEPVVAVELEVALLDGRTPAAATATFQPDRGAPVSRRWTPTEPSLEIPPGAWQLSAVAEGGDYRSEAIEVHVVEGDANAPVRVMLIPQLRIRGRVVQPPGESFGWGEVRMLPVGSGGNPTIEQLLRAGRTARLGSGQTFSFDELTAGEYALLVVYGTRPASRVVVTKVIDRPVEVEIEIDPMSPEEVLLVRLVGPDEMPISAGQVSASMTAGRDRELGRAGSVEIEPGLYRLRRPVRLADESGAKLTIWASARDWGRVLTEATPRESGEIVLRFAAPARITVRAPGIERTPLASRAGVTLQGSGGNARYDRNRDGSMIGEWRLSPVQPGRYAVRLCIERDRREWVLAHRDVTLDSGERELVLGVPITHALTVDVKNERVRRVSLRGVGTVPGRSSVYAEVEDGIASFEDLPAATYRIRGRRGEVEVRIPGTDRITLED